MEDERDGDGEKTRDSGVDVSESGGTAKGGKVSTLNLPQPEAGGRHHRRNDSTYDGSDYGDDSDMDSPGMPPGLVARIDMVESLARRGTESNGGERDEVFKRVVDGLKDLGGQSGVESSASRCGFLPSYISHLPPPFTDT